MNALIDTSHPEKNINENKTNCPFSIDKVIASQKAQFGIDLLVV